MFLHKSYCNRKSGRKEAETTNPTLTSTANEVAIIATQINNTISDQFHSSSPARVADLIGQLDRTSKSATSDLEAAKSAFKDRGLLIAEGEAFSVMLQKSIRATFDNAAVKAELG